MSSDNSESNESLDDKNKKLDQAGDLQNPADELEALPP